MKYLIREPRELQRTLNKSLQESYIWDLLTQCHGVCWPYDQSYTGTIEKCIEYRTKISTMLRNIADEVDRCDIVVDESTLDTNKSTGCISEDNN